MVNATIEKSPPIKMARRQVEDRGVRWLVAEELIRLRETARPDDLNVVRNEACHQPTHEIRTVNKKKSCHRSANAPMQSAFHGSMGLGCFGLKIVPSSILSDER